MAVDNHIVNFWVKKSTHARCLGQMKFKKTTRGECLKTPKSIFGKVRLDDISQHTCVIEEKVAMGGLLNARRRRVRGSRALPIRLGSFAVFLFFFHRTCIEHLF